MRHKTMVTYPFFVWICCYITVSWLRKFPIRSNVCIFTKMSAATSVGIQPDNTMNSQSAIPNMSLNLTLNISQPVPDQQNFST